MKIFIKKHIVDTILILAKDNYPREVVLLLRGRANQESISVRDFLIPPLAILGSSFAEFPAHLLPIDFSIVGTAHSHPSGILFPSLGDLNNFYGRIMIIFAHPFTLKHVAAFNYEGEKLSLKVIG